MLALDFTGGVIDGHVTDLSSYDNSPAVVGEPVMDEGSAPTTEYVPPPATDSFMKVDGT